MKIEFPEPMKSKSVWLNLPIKTWEVIDALRSQKGITEEQVFSKLVLAAWISYEEENQKAEELGKFIEKVAQLQHENPKKKSQPVPVGIVKEAANPSKTKAPVDSHTKKATGRWKPTKICKHCGREFIKPISLSKKNWETTMYCGNSCAKQGKAKQGDKKIEPTNLVASSTKVVEKPVPVVAAPVVTFTPPILPVMTKDEVRYSKITFSICQNKKCHKPDRRYVSGTGTTYLYFGTELEFCSGNCKEEYLNTDFRKEQ